MNIMNLFFILVLLFVITINLAVIGVIYLVFDFIRRGIKEYYEQER